MYCRINNRNVQGIEQNRKERKEMSIMINNKLSILLGDKLLKISKIAQETGISRGTLTSLYYRRSKGINFDTLDKLCNYLNCSISEIIEYVPDSIE